MWANYVMVVEYLLRRKRCNLGECDHDHVILNCSPGAPIIERRNQTCFPCETCLRLDDCVDVLRLDQLINERKLGTGKSLDEMDSVEALKVRSCDRLTVPVALLCVRLQQYITGTSQEKGYLELALQSYQELIREQHQSRSALDQGSQTPRRQMMSS